MIEALQQLHLAPHLRCSLILIPVVILLLLFFRARANATRD